MITGDVQPWLGIDRAQEARGVDAVLPEAGLPNRVMHMLAPNFGTDQPRSLQDLQLLRDGWLADAESPSDHPHAQVVPVRCDDLQYSQSSRTPERFEHVAGVCH